MSDDFGDVDDFEDPDEALALALLEDYKGRTGEDYDLYLFKEDNKWPAPKSKEAKCYQCYFHMVHPEMESLFPKDKLILSIQRYTRTDHQAQLMLQLALINSKNDSSAIIRDLLVYIGSKCVIVNGEEIDE